MTGGKIAILGVAAESLALVDVDGAYAVWLAHHTCLAAIVRPDWCLCGAAGGGAALAALLERRQVMKLVRCLLIRLVLMGLDPLVSIANHT